MELRAASAWESLAPLTVLVPIGATPVAFVLTAHVGIIAWLSIPAGLAVTVAAGKPIYGLRTAISAAGSSWLALVVALPFFYALTIHTSICGKDLVDAWRWVAPTAGAFAFLTLGSVGLRTCRTSAVPVALLGGALTMLLLTAALPGTQGICET